MVYISNFEKKVLCDDLLYLQTGSMLHICPFLPFLICCGLEMKVATYHSQRGPHHGFQVLDNLL